MPENWTGKIIGKMHVCRVSKKQLAAQLGYTPEYVSMVLNGHRTPNGAETEFAKALDELIRQKSKENGGT
ncbi:helix-turn-helix domain-containing protein [Caproicibacterium sp. BJN0003]|uniref:helix-turn-helix domain-containing protein n=1 Tax=Caproicibacterium sp. BJN0003 TaxID=2994078 RepID=UPI00225BFCBD|nr:helix-turn-helix transcriptional regulator [Caproicibacterium sp. BJN0003]UZT82929.1 helix-turn-helix transcriptional regulator [Caproicibacterium sp. BJN0003]